MPVPAHAADASPPSTPLASSVETPAPVAQAPAAVQAAPAPAPAPASAPERTASVWEQAEVLARAAQTYGQPAAQPVPSHALQPYQPAAPAPAPGYPTQYPPWAAPAPAPVPMPGYAPYAASPYAAPYQPPSAHTYEEREREQALHKHIKEIKSKVTDIATKLEVDLSSSSSLRGFRLKLNNELVALFP